MNDVFEFRDFSILQAPEGQRINTDSCVFAELVGASEIQPLRILDIGTGTGVVSLMLAHLFPEAKITAVESEVSISNIAERNFAQEVWQGRIELRRGRIQDLDVAEGEKFDLVVCNPPYFQHSTPSTNRVTANAKHNVDLAPIELYQAILRLMTAGGSAWLTFPEDCSDLWLSEGRALGLYPTHQIAVGDHPNIQPHIAVIGWARSQPPSVLVSKISYRVAAQGALSPWMKSFRRKWFPERFNKNSYAVDP